MVDISSVDIILKKCEGILITPLSESTYLVLLALYNGPLHGYAIIKAIENASQGAYVIAPGTLYGVLKNIEKQGLIETTEAEKDPRKKKTYGITDPGKKALDSEYNRYRNMIKLTDTILQDRE
ncbi:PadR family transcriptional regulator [Neobacillus mesonae]|nr:PadR family transcriptional regulator [Neobacillus mesonae]